ncbi:hypothetical protein [Dinoroseobacter sp. S124A]|uniref:hypothetical protein n=1 Tax=Dinoroseobacter sp. S124A TaxID=3415128 RepID=UPI003C7A67C5
MANPSSSDASQDVLNSIRRIVTERADKGALATAAVPDLDGPAPRGRTDIRALAAELAEAKAIGPDVLWLGAADAVRPPQPVSAPPLPDPDFANGNFADRMTSLTDRLAPTQAPEPAPVTEPAPVEAPMAAPEQPSPVAEPRPCTLLLTQEFRVRPATAPGLPPRTAPKTPAPEAYLEDSDHLGGAVQSAMIPDLTSVLREAVSETVRESVREALRAEGPLTPRAAPPEAPVVDADGYITADAVRRLVSGILHEELSGALGDEITRRVRKLVRSEVHRILQTDALD